MWIGQRGEKAVGMSGPKELYIEKWKENSCFCYSTSFYGREFPIFRARLCLCPTGQLLSVYTRSLLKVKAACVRTFYRNILLSFSVFYVSRAALAVKFSTYVRNYMLYVHIKSHFLKDMETPFEASRVGKTRRRWTRNFYIYTKFLSFFFLFHPSIRERKTCVDI